MVKQWLRELKDDVEESLQARFIFEINLIGSVNSIFCKLSIASSQIIDSFDTVQTCRCHGIPIDDDMVNRNKEPSTCPITCHNLVALDFVENAVKVGKHTILFQPTFKSVQKFQKVSLPIKINIIERTRLESLSEGVIIGTPYLVTPSNCHEIEATSDETDKSELNFQFFRGLCCALHELDQGLVCSSNCNLETMKETAFLCYYLLQPSADGPMLLRRLAGSEEVLPISDFSQSADSPVNKEIENSIQASLSKMGLSDYNPLIHERGFHQKLNLLVKESVHFGSIPPFSKAAMIEPDSSQFDSLEMTDLPDSAPDFTFIGDRASQQYHTTREGKTTNCIAEEWEQLIVNEPPKVHSPNTNPKPISEIPVLLPPYSSGIKHVDVNTSRILERLELPKKMKPKAVSPVIKTNQPPNASLHTKKPLHSIQSNCGTDYCVSASQPMKPTFQRIKRKLR